MGDAEGLVKAIERIWKSWGQMRWVVAAIGAVLLVAYAGPPIKGLFGHEVEKKSDGIIVSGVAQIGSNNVQNNVVQVGPQSRTLTREQLVSAANTLAPFRGTRINVFRYQGDGEILTLAAQIESALRVAGWNVIEITGTEMGNTNSPRPIPGILVEVRKDAGGADSAKALADALRAASLKVDGPIKYEAFGRGAVISQGNEDAEAAVQLTIGRGP